MDDDLPKAFSIDEIVAIKQESNTMFGYMEDNTKSIYLKKSIFIVFGQFATYLSAKKNQYTLTRNQHGQGKVKQYVDIDGVAWYEREVIDDEGNSLGFEKTTDVTDRPLYIWEGRITEGIFLSFMDCFNVVGIWTPEGRKKIHEA